MRTHIHLGALVALIFASAGLAAANAAAPDTEPFGPKVMEEVVVTAPRPQPDAERTVSASARAKIERLNAAMVMEEVVVTAPRPERLLALLDGDAAEKADAGDSATTETLRY
jgi:hypothetical protein